jgi:YVTN family beta-propeller protein
MWWLSLFLVAVGAVAAEAQPLAYVTNFGYSAVSAIDTATNTVVATVVGALMCL